MARQAVQRRGVVPRRLRAPIAMVAGLFVFVLLIQVHLVHNVVDVGKALYQEALQHANNQLWLGCRLRTLPVLHTGVDGSTWVVWVTTCPPTQPPHVVMFSDTGKQAGGSTTPSSGSQQQQQQQQVYNATVYAADATHHVHKASLGVLEPGRHVYRVVSGEQMLGSMHVARVPPVAAPAPASDVAAFKAVVLSDNQSQVLRWTHLLRQAVREAPDAVLHLGDAVQSSGLRQYDQMLDAYSSLGSVVPMISARGNHDSSKGPRALRPHYVPSDRGDRTWFAVTIAGVRWIVIESWSSSTVQNQADWLTQELSSPATREALFRVVLTHIPPFIEFWNPASWRGGERLWGRHVRETLLPIMQQNNVDILLGGHSHMYQRGRVGNITLVTCGGAGGDLESASERVEDWGIFKPELNQFVFHYVSVELRPRLVSADGHSGTSSAAYRVDMQVAGVDTDGREFDRFSISSRAISLS